jgi:hypothetical protein
LKINFPNGKGLQKKNIEHKKEKTTNKEKNPNYQIFEFVI